MSSVTGIALAFALLFSIYGTAWAKDASTKSSPLFKVEISVDPASLIGAFPGNKAASFRLNAKITNLSDRAEYVFGGEDVFLYSSEEVFEDQVLTGYGSTAKIAIQPGRSVPIVIPSATSSSKSLTLRVGFRHKGEIYWSNYVTVPPLL
ncbi:MAG TPA: hypothetical protein VMU16_11795 [Candidatus Binataceae bacterium]|nr:hypothetical protein [Candidatus Binataceae bacterium]